MVIRVGTGCPGAHIVLVLRLLACVINPLGDNFLCARARASDAGLLPRIPRNLSFCQRNYKIKNREHQAGWLLEDRLIVNYYITTEREMRAFCFIWAIISTLSLFRFLKES